MASEGGARGKSLGILTGFKATQQVTVLASVDAALTVLKKSLWQSPGAALC